MATLYIENYQPAIKYNGGLQTALPVILESTLAVTGATTFTGAIVASGGITGTSAVPLTNGTLYPIVPPSTAPTAYATDTTLVAANLNTNVTNTGASGTITLTLPAVSGLAGYTLHVELTVAQIVRIDPAGTETIFLGGSGAAGKYANIAAVIGNMVDIYCDGTRWLIIGRDGVVTKEA